MKIFIIITIVLSLQILTYIIIRGGTMYKSDKEIADEFKAQKEYLIIVDENKQARKKRIRKGIRKLWKKIK